MVFVRQKSITACKHMTAKQLETAQNINNNKLSYLQRKRASNMAILYGADGISI